MNFSRIALSGLAGTVAYFALGFLFFALLPLAEEVRQFPDVYRSEESMQSVAPIGMVAMLLSMMALATLFASVYRNGSSTAEGVRFGVLIAIFSAGAFVLHNYVSLNIGLRLALFQALAYFSQLVGSAVAIAIIYRPNKSRNQEHA